MSQPDHLNAEQARLSALRDQHVLDTVREDRFDRIATLAADHFGVPIALVSLVDAERQWFKAAVGLSVAETPREWAFCAHSIMLGPNAVLVVEDATQDPRFADNPLVCGSPDIRFYAGAVLTTRDGYNLGTLCVIDSKPHPRPSDADLAYLQTLARLVVDQLDLSRAQYLLAEQRRLMMIAESLSGVGHWRYDLENQVATWSDQAFRIHGIPLSDGVPGIAEIRELYHEDDREALANAVSHVRATGEGCEVKLRIRRPDGAVRFTSAKAECGRDSRGRVTSIFGVFQDITEQHLAAATLAESEQRYRLLADNVSDVIAIYNSDGVISYISPSITDLLGYTPDEIIGKTPFDYMHPDDQERVAAQFKTAATTHAALTVEYRVRARTGEMRWLEAKPRFRWNSAGEVIEITDSVRDVTERRFREVALRQAQLDAEAATRAKATFLANMSHEIRTPMNGVLGFAELLLTEPLADGQRRKIEMIAESGTAMMRLLNDILDLSKVESGQLVMAEQAFDPRALLNSCVQLMTPMAESKALPLGLRVESDVPGKLLGDDLRLRQVVLNLLGNAVKFTETGSVIVSARLSSDAPTELLEISVEDTGIGIAAERQAAVLGRFVQGDDETGRRFGGTGLGLTISAQLVRLMGGTLAIRSEPGVGTVVTVTLPLRPVNEKPLPVRARPALVAAPPEPPAEKCRVLVAEDHEINQLLTTAMLAQIGCASDVVCDGAAAVTAILEASQQGRPYDLVLMDMQMPHMDGLEATRRVREAGIGWAALPIIALTANAYDSDIVSCLAAGMQGHLAKPVSIVALDAIINQWVDAPVQPVADQVARRT